METQEILIDITPMRTPHYPSFCEIFLKKAGELDKAAIRMVTSATQAFPINSPEGRIVGHMAGNIFANSAANKTHSLKQRALAAVQIIPLQSAQNFCATRMDEINLAFADKKVGYLAPIVGPDLVAVMLPKELKTPDAAAFMHRERRYALKAVIEHALSYAQPA